jgi:hypothetical protein
MRIALYWSIIAVASTATGAATAADNLKGTYYLVGAQTGNAGCFGVPVVICLRAFSFARKAAGAFAAPAFSVPSS